MKLFECDWLGLEPIFGDDYEHSTGSIWVCARALHRLWEFPRKAHAVKLFLHSRPAQDRVEITGISTVRRGVAPRLYFIFGERGIRRAQATAEQAEYVENAIESNSGKPVYAELWYEE